VQKGLFIGKVERLADLSLNTIVKIETEKNLNPTTETLQTLQKIAKALGVTVGDLFK